MIIPVLTLDRPAGLKDTLTSHSLYVDVPVSVAVSMATATLNHIRSVKSVTGDDH